MKIVEGISFVMFMACASLIAGCSPSKPVRPGNRTARLTNIVTIRNALQSFKESEKRWPTNLYELQTRSFGKLEISHFYSPSEYTNGAWFIPPQAATNAALLDDYGFYRLHHVDVNKTTIVIHERLGIWRLTGQVWFDGGVYGIDQDLNGVFIPPAEAVALKPE